MRRPLRSLGLLLSLVLPATGCGIRATDVVEVGDAAVVEVTDGGSKGTILYFVHAGELKPVTRPFEILPKELEAKYGTADDRSRGSSEKVLALLLEGPDEGERQAGLGTQLPPLIGPALFEQVKSGVVLRMKSAVTGLSDLARQQLVCTAAEAVAPGGRQFVTVEGTDGYLGPDRCML